MIFVGDDWAEAHHDVCLMTETGEPLGYWKLPEGIEGIGRFHGLVASHVSDPSQVVVGIETDRGLWVDALVAGGYQVFGINPLSVARYRAQHHLSGAKSDRADAKLLADLVRTGRQNHRQVAGDSDVAEATRVLARSHQNLIWERQRHLNGLRSRLRDYYPAGVALLTALPQRDAVAVLGRAPTPDVGHRLTKPQIKAALKKGGRQRRFEPRVDEIHQILGTKHLDTPPVVADAFGAATTATVSIITTIDAQIAELANALEQCFKKHPDAAIYLSLPGIGDVIGARVLGEFGDDPNRYATAKSRRNYAGTSPLTKQSGRKKIVMARWIRKRRLYDAIDQWALTACNTSPGAKALYNHRRAQGDWHHQALRAVGNRLVGFLHGCLKTRTLYDENIAWQHQEPTAIKKAA
ncbi:MAG: IS110 family transposase [Acidimicrobiia bacterium]